MDALADTGSRWVCAAAHALGTASFEMQACGDSGTRYWIGVLAVLGAALLAIVALWRLGFAERGGA